MFSNFTMTRNINKKLAFCNIAYVYTKKAWMAKAFQNLKNVIR